MSTYTQEELIDSLNIKQRKCCGTLTNTRHRLACPKSKSKNAHPGISERIFHKAIGEGTVVAFRHTPLGVAVVIDFDNIGKKELVWQFAKADTKRDIDGEWCAE